MRGDTGDYCETDREVDVESIDVDEVTAVPPFRYPGEGSGVVLTQEQIDRRNRA